MTRAALPVAKALALTISCDYCGSEAGVWCMRRSRSTGEVTGRAAWLHAARSWRFEDAVHAGVTQGHVWGLTEVLENIDPTHQWSAMARGELRTWADLRAHLDKRIAQGETWQARAAQRVADNTGYDISV
jgi:hypothetical protein